MATRDTRPEPPLIVIVGPTASGKTALAIELAEQFNGEIICADSRTIYKGMDIGTAKPTKKEQERVPHWGLDLVEPGENFNVVDFKAYAQTKIEEIRARGCTPFLVGGTGLYIDAIVFDYQFGAPPDQTRRILLDSLSLEELYQYCQKNNIDLPENYKNRRYVIRAIEQKNVNTKKRFEPPKNCIIVGITTDKEILRTRMTARSEHIFDDGVVEEATILGKKYGWDNEGMTGNIYPLIRQYLSGELSYDQLKEKNTTLDWRLAKRQLTWLKRNTYIQWFELPEARRYLTQRLANS